MGTKVTVQDIADALGLSRTTVSKVLNQSPAVSSATRERVLNKVRELGYREIRRAPDASASAGVDCVALVMHMLPTGNHIGTVVIPSLDRRLRQQGFSLITCTVSDEEYDTLHIPPILESLQVKAVVALEMFHPTYSKLLCGLGKPVVFIDACTDFLRLDLTGDLLLMESRNSSAQMMNTLIQQHHITTMGFMGDKSHCISFQERYEAFLLTAVQNQVEIEPYSILGDDRLCVEPDWVRSQLEHMPNLPQLFFCANDYLAQVLIHVLESMGKTVPEDVLVCGFDGVPSLSRPFSTLTTVVTPVDDLGACAARLLLEKCSAPLDAPSITYLKTHVVFRESTK